MPVKAPIATRHLEVERKFEVVESTVTPSFEGISIVARVEKSSTQTLDATYFDTPTQDLARNKITLRRRTGGTDSGWHLKLPERPDTRTEIRTPLAAPDSSPDNTIPSELLDVVLAIVRDRPVEPIARITTKREIQALCSIEGATLAEFCDDRVTAWSIASATKPKNPTQQQWREWELEFVTTNEAVNRKLVNRLTNRLLDAGATPASHSSKLARVLDTGPPANDKQPFTDPVHRAIIKQVAELLRWDRAARADTYDAVHQMRATTRKIRSLLSDSQGWLGLSDGAWVLDELRELASVLGVARDAEVLSERYQRALDQLPPELVRGPVRERLVEGTRRRYQTGLRRSLIAMRSQRYFRLLDALDALVAEIPVADLSPEPLSPISIDAAYKRVRKAARAADQTDKHDEAVHQIRKRAKRLRYIAAATGADRVSQRAKNIQTLLGNHQDSVLSRQYLLGQAEAAHADGEATFTHGLLFQQEADLADRCLKQLDAALRQLDKSARKARR